jgi:hypothetical protein
MMQSAGLLKMARRLLGQVTNLMILDTLSGVLSHF